MVDQDVILRQKDLNIVYSAMHGTGRVIIPMALRSWGFQNIHVVPEQMVIDGNSRQWSARIPRMLRL